VDELIKTIKENKYNFQKGTLINYQFLELPNCVIKNCIRIRIKENYIEKLNKILKSLDINIKEKISDKYHLIYEMENEKYIYIQFIVNSHVLVPECLLKDFVSKDKHLYYIDTVDNKINKTSKRKYNTILGYYTKYFEEYLSKKYENKIGEIKKKIEELVFDRVKEIQFVGLSNDIKSLLNMSFFRNPRFIEEINKESLSSRLINGGYKSEDVAMFYENYGSNILKGYEIYLLNNRTTEGLVLSKEIFSNILIHDANESIILPLHPKYAVLLVPRAYYEDRKRKYGENSYMIIKDLDTLYKINKYIYMQCKKYKIDVIGMKEDLEKILKYV